MSDSECSIGKCWTEAQRKLANVFGLTPEEIDRAESDPNTRSNLLDELETELQEVRDELGDPQFYWPSGKTRKYILGLHPKLKFTRERFNKMPKSEVDQLIKDGKATLANNKSVTTLQVIGLRTMGYEGPAPDNIGEYNSIMEGLLKDVPVTPLVTKKLRAAGVNVGRLKPNTPLKKVLSACKRHSIRLNLELLADLLPASQDSDMS